MSKWTAADPLVKLIGLTLILGHVLSEAHGFIWDLYPKIETVNLDLFWSSSFKMQLPAQWYVKILFDDFLYVLILYAFAKSVIDRSMKVYMICVVFIIYHIADIFCFMWNYKQDRLIYWALVWCSSASVIILILPQENKMKMVR